MNKSVEILQFGRFMTLIFLITGLGYFGLVWYYENSGFILWFIIVIIGYFPVYTYYIVRRMQYAKHEAIIIYLMTNVLLLAYIFYRFADYNLTDSALYIFGMGYKQTIVDYLVTMAALTFMGAFLILLNIPLGVFILIIGIIDPDLEFIVYIAIYMMFLITNFIFKLLINNELQDQIVETQEYQ